MLGRAFRHRCPLATLGLLVAASIGCEVHYTERGFRIGSGCESMDESCKDAKTGNKCVDNKLVEVSCLGPDGCVDEPPQDVACDSSVSEPGAACPSLSGASCTTDRTILLECEQGKFVKDRDCAKCKITRTKAGSAVMSRVSCGG